MFRSRVDKYEPTIDNNRKINWVLTACQVQYLPCRLLNPVAVIRGRCTFGSILQVRKLRLREGK